MAFIRTVPPTETDLQYLELEPNIRKAMQKGRPFAEGSICPHCYGTHIIKKIRSRDGREEYFCPYCQTGGLVNPKNKFSEAQKLQNLEHYERYNPRSMKETFGVSPATLQNGRRKVPGRNVWPKESDKRDSPLGIRKWSSACAAPFCGLVRLQ